MIRSILRWVLRGERNVSASLEAISSDLRALQRRVDDLSVEHDDGAVDDDGRPSSVWRTADPLRTDGVNVVGYLRLQSGLGDAARRLVSALRAAGTPVAPLAHDESPSPAVDVDVDASDVIDHETTIAVVPADQIPVLVRAHPEIGPASRGMIGYCFWELDRLSPESVAGVALLDEVWAPTAFIHDTFSAETARAGIDIPIRYLPLPVEEPEPSDRAADDFPPLADRGDRVVFGATFDHLSTAERKNPLGAIEAYRRAFPDDEGEALLVVKTLNADAHPDAHRRIVEAAADRSDVCVWDAYLTTGDQLAFLAHLDVLVSLHRSEGFGLHLAEAMWLGTPVVATGYSGNLDFMDDECACLVDHGFVEVADGGGIYPPGARWADPDLDHAARHLRTLATDADLRNRLSAAARRRMASRPGAAAVGTMVGDLLAGRIPSGLDGT